MNKMNCFKIMLTLCLMALCWLPMSAQSGNLLGDVDDDGEVGIADVSALIDYLLTDDATGINLINADVDEDGEVGIADVSYLIDMLLNMDWNPAEDDWVDLGLPSGTLWATRNIGANSPEEWGDYFAWGETAPKDVYNWSTYKWCNGSDRTMTKYCTNGSYGTVDDLTELELEDDAAYVNWGPSWRMPTTEQQRELVNECTWMWTTLNGVNGYIVTGPNGNTLFLPAADLCDGSTHYNVGASGRYWSRTLYFNGSPDCSISIDFNREKIWGNYVHGRYYGFSVRAVRN